MLEEGTDNIGMERANERMETAERERIEGNGGYRKIYIYNLLIKFN